MKRTSIQYQLTNNYLFKEVFLNWKEFDENLAKGPQAMKEYLLHCWNIVKEDLINHEDLEVLDINKDVTVDDFNITFNKSQSGVPVYFFTFPDCEFIDASSKYIALALTPSKPRYFTLEYSEDYFTKNPSWTIGEFIIKDDTKIHNNFGFVDNMRLPYFAGRIVGLLDSK